MKTKVEISLLTLALLFSFSSISFCVEPVDPADPRWKKFSPWVNPKSTYLRTCEDNPLNAKILDLNDYDLSIGDWIIISTYGDFLHVPSSTTPTQSMSVVFSTSTTLLTDEVTRLKRVPGAVPIPEGGVAYGTFPTWMQCKEDPVGDPDADPINLETDIPEDFLGGGVNLVKVPARYLFVSAGATRWFSDNIDPEGDYRVMLTDEMMWDQDSLNCTTCWNDPNNWEPEVVPDDRVGLTFDTTGPIRVTNHDSLVKYVRIINGAEVELDGIGDITTTINDPEKYSLLIDGLSSLRLASTGASFFTNWAYIGYEDFGGNLEVSDGEFTAVNLYVGLKNAKGFVEVSGDGTTLKHNFMAIGAFDDAAGELKILNGGHADNIGNGASVFIGKYGSTGGVRARVYVESLGKLSSEYIHINSGGMLIIREGIVDVLAVFVDDGGVITGCQTGMIRGNVSDQGGLLAPGCSPGKLLIDGNYTQEAEGTLQIEIGGYQQEKEYDVLEVTGVTTLGGILQLDFINGFAPKKGDVFEFLKIAGTASGSFSNVTIKGLEDGFEYDISVESGATRLVALNDGVSSYKFPWLLFLPTINGSEK